MGRNAFVARALGIALAVLLVLFLVTGVMLAHALAAGESTTLETVMMDPHMQLTIKRAPRAGDRERAEAIVVAARAVMAKYANVTDAESDGYQKFLPGILLPTEHYTKGSNALAAAWGAFDPASPTSLIYTRTPNGLVIAGVMYTAPNRASAADLDAKVPMSIGSWHRHVDFCWAPNGAARDPRFGFEGTIADRASCAAAGGRFTPLLFNWMIHVWANERTTAAIWDVEHGMEHDHGAGMLGGSHAFASLPIAPARLPAQAVAAGDRERGSVVFAQNCAACHGAAAKNGPDAPALAGAGLSAGQVAFMVRHPRDVDAASPMPALPISDADLADVAAYVASLRE